MLLSGMAKPHIRNFSPEQAPVRLSAFYAKYTGLDITAVWRTDVAGRIVFILYINVGWDQPKLCPAEDYKNAALSTL